MQIFDSELRVLEVLWEEGEIRASQVCKVLEKEWGGTEIQLIQSLKNVLKRDI